MYSNNPVGKFLPYGISQKTIRFLASIISVRANINCIQPSVINTIIYCHGSYQWYKTKSSQCHLDNCFHSSCSRYRKVSGLDELGVTSPVWDKWNKLSLSEASYSSWLNPADKDKAFSCETIFYCVCQWLIFYLSVTIDILLIHLVYHSWFTAHNIPQSVGDSTIVIEMGI